MKNLSIIIKVLFLLFVWVLWSGAISNIMDLFINVDFPGFLQLVIIICVFGVTAMLVNSSILFIQKQFKKIKK